MLMKYLKIKKKHRLFISDIDEYHMGFYGGLISLFENKETPTRLANPKNQWFDLNSHKSLIFCDNFMFLRKLAYNPDENLSGTPFALTS
jgi:hypothetical protein